MSNIKAATRPETKIIKVELDGELAGWWADCRAASELPARALVELQAVDDAGNPDIAKIIGAFDRVVVRHNFPNADGEVADSMLDVEPLSAVLTALQTWSDKAVAPDPR